VPALVLFDIDGTLILTGGAGSRAMTRAFEEVFGVPQAFAGVPMAGRTDRAIFQEAAARAGLLLADEAADRFRRRYYACLREEIERPGPGKGVMPGAREVLDELSADPRVALALLTGNFAEAARIKLEYFALWRYFPWGVFGDEVVDRAALVPRALAEARARALPVHSSRQVIIVGDTPHDVACARAAGARAVAVATGGFDEATLARAGADLVLTDLRDRVAFRRIVDEAARE
jgi:phosphoglycolate phosphatase